MIRDTTASRRRHGRQNRRTSAHRYLLEIQPGLVGTFRRICPWMVSLVALVGTIVGVHFGWQSLCGSERLHVHALELQGATRVRNQDLSAYTGISLGDSILHVDLDAAALSLRRHPWVRSARVQRRLPDRIVVEVEEFVPQIVVALEDLYLASSDGRLFKRFSPEDGIVLPVLTGIAREQVADAPERVAATIRDGTRLHLAVAQPSVNLGRIEEIHWDVDLGWSIICVPGERKEPIRIDLGPNPIERIPFAELALANLTDSHDQPVELWADGSKNPGRVYVRMRQRVEQQGEQTLLAKAR